MKKSIFAIAALAALVSCQSLKEEWQPVFTCGDPGANLYVPVTEEYLKAEKGLEEFTTIADLKALYKGEPVVVDGNVWIKGQVISSDENGNIYNEIYLQDATGGIDLKIGKGSTHNEYPLGQWVYVKCDGFTLGAYSGMPQLGMQADQTETNEYETSYINLPGLIETHIFRGFVGTPIVPKAVDEAAIAASLSKGYKGDLWGTLVTIKGLVYDNQIFALVYPNPNLPHKKDNPENRVFLSDNGTWGIDTWALSKARYISHIQSGAWDSAEVDSGGQLSNSYITKTPNEVLTGTGVESRIAVFGMDAFLPYKDIMVKYAQANYVSHYFKLGATAVQIRSSGFSKFADMKVDPEILAGKPVDVTGILCIYDGGAQFTLVDDPSVSVVLE